MKQKTRVIAGAIGVLVLIALGVVLRLGVAEEGPRWHPWDGPTVARDLDDAVMDTLRILVLRDALVYEERPKATAGLEYELLLRFARKLKLKLKAIAFDHPDSVLLALWRGDGDLAALQAVDRDEWKGHFAVSDAYAATVPVVATLRGDVRTQDSIAHVEAALDSVPRAWASPFADPDYAFHRALQKPPAAPSVSTEEELLMGVVAGTRPAAIISAMRAGHEAERFPILEFTGAMGPPQKLRFAVRASSPLLRKALDEWLSDDREAEARKHIIRAYADEVPKQGALRARRMKGIRRDSISPFDDEFRKHAASTGWDWQLLAAMAWKETRFDSTVTSHRGATGIMQFMPGTAERMGLDSSSHMGDHINAAARYLSRLDLLWLRQVPDKEQRLRFVLASYNAGPGHVIDAQRLAGQMGLDPARWDGNVERAVLLLAKPRYFMRPGIKNGFCKGNQVFLYVRGVLAVHRQLKGR